MRQPPESWIFSSVPAFLRAEPTFFPYLFRETGLLLDIDPEEFPDSPTSSYYCPLHWEIFGVRFSAAKLKQGKTDSENPKKVFILRQEAWEQ